MADIYMDVDAALAGVPVNLMPLVDDTDFKTIEGAVAYNAAGMALRWHFVTSAGAYTVTSVTPTTAGVHDWTDPGDSGVYTLEIPASGGTINNDTEGYGWFTGVATGILPWRGPVIGFRAAAINDALMDGGDLLDVSLVQVAGATTDVSALATNVAAILVDTGTTLQAELDGIQADTEDIQTRLPAALVGGRIDATVDATGMEAGAVTAIRDGIILRTTVRGAAATGTLSTTQCTTSGMSPAMTAADQLKGRIIIFDHDTATAALRGQATDITASSAASNPLLTFTALTTAPANGDTFTIV